MLASITRIETLWGRFWEAESTVYIPGIVSQGLKGMPLASISESSEGKGLWRA
jgi:hypothetical protein